MSRSRRSLLRLGGGLIGGCLAGCTAPSAPSTDQPTPRTDGGTPTGGGGDAARSIALTDVDDPPDLPVRPGVAIVAETATDAHPPQVRITVTNESDATVSVGEGRAIVFAYVADTTGTLLLLPAAGDYPVAEGCWRLTEPIAITTEYRITTLQPGEATSRVVGVYATPTDADESGTEAGCLPTGTFRFETTYNVGQSADTVPDGDAEATWGFSLAVT